MLVQTQQFDGQVHRFVVAKCDAVQTSNSGVVEITGVGKGRPEDFTVVDGQLTIRWLVGATNVISDKCCLEGTASSMLISDGHFWLLCGAWRT